MAIAPKEDPDNQDENIMDNNRIESKPRKDMSWKKNILFKSIIQWKGVNDK